MALLSRLFPTWKTLSLSVDRQGSFSWVFRWLEKLFKKPAIEPVNPKPSVATPEVPKPDPTMNVTSVARFATNLSSRTPMIKFLGPRSPRPHFDPSKLPPVPRGSVAVSSSTTASSIGKIGTTPKGSGMDESQLPLRFRRRPIDEEEIAAINNGGAYGL